MRKKSWLVIFLCFIILCFTGCGQEITEEDIKSSTIYKDLESDYSQLKREYESIKDLANTNEKSESRQLKEVKDYLSFIKNSTFVKVQFTCNEKNISDFSTNKSLLKWLSRNLAKGIVNSNADSKKYLAKQPSYTYILFNEDNSICRCFVYEDNNVIFSDYQDYVFYVEGITRLGDGTLDCENQEDLPARSFYTRLYESQLVFENNQMLSLADSKKFAKELYQEKAKHLANQPETNEEAKRELVFYSDGECFVVSVYEHYFSVLIDNSHMDWYQTKEIEEEATTEMSS